jgi:phosphoserine phosphatase
LAKKKLSSVELVVFDMDGVLVDIDSSWMLIHRAFGTDNEEGFQRYSKGEIDFKEFMRSDIEKWNKADINLIKSILSSAPLMLGAKETIKTLKEAGYRTAIISSGISLLAEMVQAELGIDHVLANRLLFDDEGRLTGDGEVVVELQGKFEALRKLTAKLGLTPIQTAIVGDSRFDVPMFKASALSIAFNPKDIETEVSASITVKGRDLRMILPYLVIF